MQIIKTVLCICLFLKAILFIYSVAMVTIGLSTMRYHHIHIWGNFAPCLSIKALYMLLQEIGSPSGTRSIQTVSTLHNIRFILILRQKAILLLRLTILI